LLRERAFPAREIVAFASERSVGRVLQGAGPGGSDLTVRGLDQESIQGFESRAVLGGRLDLGRVGASLCGGRRVVVDNSSRWRMQDDVPLVVSEVNPRRSPAIAESSRTRTARRCRWSWHLKPLHDAAGIERL